MSWWSRWVWQRRINCERDNMSENFLPSIEREVNAFEKMAGWLVIFPLCIQLSDWEDGYRSQVWLVGGGGRPVTHQTILNCSQQQLSQSPCLNLAVRISPTKQTLFKPQTCLLDLSYWWGLPSSVYMYALVGISSSLLYHPILNGAGILCFCHHR